MTKSLQTLFCALVLCTQTAFSLWDFAVTTPTKILFYNEHWREITESAHRFDHLSAITFDETEEIVYFNDEVHNNGSIFSLKIPTPSQESQEHIIEDVVQRTQNETIRSIAYDPLNRNLYWTDMLNKKIYFASVDAAAGEKPLVFLDFSQEDTLPDGVAIDICRRTLYWTNSNFSNASIERVDLDGKGRTLIVSKNIFAPHGIVVDQLSDRIYWVVDQQGIHFSVESAKLDGSDRHVIVRDVNNEPVNLAVTEEGIFWTDLTYKAIWSHSKFNATITNESRTVEEEEERIAAVKPHKILTFADKPRGIVARTHFLTHMENDEHCAHVVKILKTRLLTPKPTRSPVDMRITLLQREFCVNGGQYSEQSAMCLCEVGFKGARCEIEECHNYCVHGTCMMTSMGFPACTCQKGFYGGRCQSYKCSDYCFNEGSCKIESNDEPECECKDGFGGARCEHNSTEICLLYCRILKLEPETKVPFGCVDICEDLALLSENGLEIYAMPKYQHLEACKQKDIWTSTVIIVLVCGVVACFSLVLLIVQGLRRFYKPARPRIKKTFVVRKQASASSDTPLTNRPMATEQCEITIENCCNMNICDTPCFDPKLVQQSLSRNSNSKEDKKMLIHSMEDELY